MELINLYFSYYLKFFHVDTAFLGSKAGLITFIKKSIFHDPAFASPIVFEKGRIMKSVVQCDKLSMIFCNFHNYELASANFSLFKTDLFADVDASLEGSSFVFLGGDFNVAKEGLSDIDHHFPLASTKSRSNYGVFAKSINDIFLFN